MFSNKSFEYAPSGPDAATRRRSIQTLCVKTMKITKIEKIRAQWFGSVDDGKQLEIVAVDYKGKDVENVPYPLATIVADEKDESLLVELYTEKGIVRVPLSELQRAFEMASNEVHSEEWYEKNVYNPDENT